jgi:predicted ATPase
MPAADQTIRKSGLVAEIVLTGGPCGGKTTSLRFLSASLASLGYRVLLVPEVATTLYTGGVGDVGRLASEEREVYRKTQKMIARKQRSDRVDYREYADAFAEPVIVIYDRGEMDCAAYLTPEEFQLNLDELGVSVEEIRDTYDAVIHMRTAAGTPFGDLFNNAGRRESDPAEAIAACDRTLEAWRGHPHHYVIDNHVSLEVKLAQLFSAVTETIARTSGFQLYAAA